MSLIWGEFLLAATVTITMVTVMFIIMQSIRISLKNIGKYWMVWIFIVPWGWILITLKILWLFFLHFSCEISQHPLNNLHRYSCFPEDESPWHFSDPLDHRKNFWIPVDLWMNCNNFGVPKFSYLTRQLYLQDRKSIVLEATHTIVQPISTLCGTTGRCRS